VLVKAAVLFALLRVLGQASVTGLLVGVFAVLSVASIVWGNLVAMRQTSLRRLIAYSSVAHAGYLVLALLGPAGGRFQSVTLYLLAYGAMNLLLLASLPADEDDERRDRVESLRGLFQRSPYAAVMIAVAVLSLAGIPPLPGFIAKFLVFAQVMAAGHVALAVAGLVASYLGIYFYLRLVQLMFMSPAPAHAGAPASTGAVDVATGVLCLVPAVAVSVFPGWVLGQL
jgi:NADH-quinone oxidoreductase subunit N